ncbi:MAG: carbamoyltransferase N-terminal domain-containing protein, partial [Candidatus Rhabdochlamydia sp.]
MFTLGISGGFDKPEYSFLPKVPVWLYHDAGAAIFKDKELIAAVEQERFNRIKNTTKFPVEAIRYCLDVAGIELDQVKNIGYYFKNDFVNEELNLQYIQYPSVPIKSCEELLTERFREYFSPHFTSSKLTFVQHHLCHAHMAYYQSGFNDALVCIIDGQGEKESISLYSIQDGKLNFITDYPDSQSLGSLYLQSIRIYGYYFFDEYKVMGLAPYGDSSRYRHIFQKIYKLLPDGKYEYTVPLAGI